MSRSTLLPWVLITVHTLNTSKSSIIKMSPAGVNITNSCSGAPWTVDNPCLPSSAEQIIQEDGAKSLSKVRIGVVGVSYVHTQKKGKQMATISMTVMLSQIL